MAMSAMAGGVFTAGALSYTGYFDLRRSALPISNLALDSTTPYLPDHSLQTRIGKLPLYQRIMEQEGFKRAPYHPLLVGGIEGLSDSTDDMNADQNSNGKRQKQVIIDNDPEHHKTISQILSLDAVEGTLMRGKLLFRKGGIEHGSGWVSKDRRTLVMFVHLGDLICGHKGLVHGGLISAIFDDCMGYLFFADAASKYIGYTANLNINFKNTMPVNKTIAVCVRIKEHKGRKVYLTAEAHDAECLFEPVDPSSTTATANKYGSGEFADLVGGKSIMYANAESLFIIPKDTWGSRAAYRIYSFIAAALGA
ncbi:hypothetical protein BDV3_004680 [Batrachochytrium dendrobatidis]